MSALPGRTGTPLVPLLPAGVLALLASFSILSIGISRLLLCNCSDQEIGEMA